MNPSHHFKKTSSILTIALTLTFGLMPHTKAVLPAPDGGYPGGNTAEGQSALFALTTGGYNTAVGWLALRAVTEGKFNTAVGAGTLLSNTGEVNTATGVAALLSNTTGSNNTANGVVALFNNTTGQGNTAAGAGALLSNTTASDNTANGFHALFLNNLGGSNTADGSGALRSNNNGYANTAVGTDALPNNTTGFNNTALGIDAGAAVTTAGNVTCIGALMYGADVSNTTWLGNVYGVTTQSGTTSPVVVSDSGQLGTAASSERFKKDIATMDDNSEVVLSLRPVTFHYKTDTKNTPQFGLIAEEVAKVNPALVLPDKEGKPYTVRYDAVNAMLLNEFLKEHRKVEALQVSSAQQRMEFESKIAHQQKQIEALTAGLQKVSAQLDASKPAPQVVNNNQ